jgi:Ca-activated chloride channel family protein
MFDGIYFEFPWFFLLLILFMACHLFCKMKLPSFYFPHIDKFKNEVQKSSKILLVLKWLGIVMMILALMSPVKDEPYEPEPSQGYEIALILDTSGSMNARGFDIKNPFHNRFDAVQNIVKDFIENRPDDNMGLVVFGEYSFIAAPLTYDKEILKQILAQLHIAMAGETTALYESLAQGVHLLRGSVSKEKIAILLTDGYSTIGADVIPLDVAIDMAKKEGVKVYTIGIGMPHEYNRKVLEQIAKETGGAFFAASNANTLEKVYKEIDALETSEIEKQILSYLQYYYTYPLFLALLSLMLYIYLRNKKGYL